MNDAIKLFADFLDKVQYEDLPTKVIDRTKRFILDTLGVAIAGSSAPGCRETLEVYSEWGGREEATVWLFGRRLPVPAAGLLNSLLVHARDFDDTFDESALHALATTLPPALVLAERERISGRDLITAVVCGVEVVVQLGLAIRRPLSWIRTATCGGFGAVAAAGKVLKLSRKEMLNAFGVMYSKTSGNAQCLLDGGLSKRLQPGFAVSDALQSVALAKRGINGAKEVLEGSYGFFNLYEHGEYDREGLVGGIGNRYHIMDLSFKPYPSCRMTHATIQTILKLRDKYDLKPEEVEGIHVIVSSMVKKMVGGDFIVRDNPQVDGQFSIPYTVAVALTKGDVFIEDFEEEVIRHRSETWKSLIERVEIEVDDTLMPKDMKHSSVKIILKDGRTYEAEEEALIGSPNLDMSWEACVEKFRKCIPFSARPLEDVAVGRLLDMIGNLESLEDVSLLVKYLVA
jgi:2-methylcitrate dehydratase PrpD